MEEQTTPNNNMEPENAPAKRGGKGKTVLNVLLVLLLLGLIAAVFLYMDAKQNVSEREREVAALRGRVATLEGSASEPAEATAVECTGGANYAADIGKFTIDLDSPRVIVRRLDAGFEGGPITSLEIGTCLADEENVVDMPPAGEVKIIGHPASSSAELRTQYESRSGALTASGTMTIDGVTAQKYTLDGLFSTTVVYFDNNGIGYEIELSDTNDATNATLTDLTNDWSFTP